MRVRTLLILALGTAAPLALVTSGDRLAPTASAAFPGQNGLIVFASDRVTLFSPEGDFEIYTMDPANPGNLTFLTINLVDDEFPAWSADGKRIAFSRRQPFQWGDIFTMNADGSNQTRRTKNKPDGPIDLFPVWSPNRKRIAFFRNGAPKIGIFTMRVNGSDKTRLSYGSYPAWSPNGKKIAFARFQGGTSDDIFTMRADGSRLTRLTTHPGYDQNPNWSPDGTKIAFQSDRDGNWEIYVMNADGSNQTRLTNNPGVDAAAAWSPDGTKIAFQSDRDGNFEIYVMNANGSNETRLTDHPGVDQSPDWQPT